MKTIIWTILVDYPLSMPDIVRRSTRAVSQIAHCCLRPSGVSSQNLGRARHGPFFHLGRPFTAQGAGVVPSPAPRGRCMKTLSIQRPNLNPTARSRPARTKPTASCSRIDGLLAESPMTAIICR